MGERAQKLALNCLSMATTFNRRRAVDVRAETTVLS
jgi:hypothetical protein